LLAGWVREVAVKQFEDKCVVIGKVRTSSIWNLNDSFCVREYQRSCSTRGYNLQYFYFVKVNHSQRMSQKPLTPSLALPTQLSLGHFRGLTSPGEREWVWRKA
jgi:hypothetical protein